ncbi:MAG: VWA domain-containing protein [Acidobacteriia bacterium]|nr:VWA domain-containing protein [Terriglobia bacterium]
MLNKVAVSACALLGLGGLLSVSGQDQVLVFKTEVRQVVVYATVTDQKGRYLANLTKDQFEVRDNGERQEIAAFEAATADFSCAILLDSTGSMQAGLPVVKNAILRLIDSLRADDSFAVYTFTTSLAQLQEFTRDKYAAKKAVLGIRAGGATALFDAIAQISTDLSRQKGKKSIIAFTDGGENASFLNASAAMTRARSAGTPIYTIAQGEALTSPRFLGQLKLISSWTGASTYTIRQSRDIDEIFQKITQSLQNTYMLAYEAPPVVDSKWRTIQLALKGISNVRIHAKEGYFPK